MIYHVVIIIIIIIIIISIEIGHFWGQKNNVYLIFRYTIPHPSGGFLK